MNRARGWGVFAAVLLVAGAALGAPRDPAQEQKIDEAVAAVDPALVLEVHQGNRAMDEGRAADAVARYRAVHDKVPAAVDVTRRLCTAEGLVGDVESAIGHCREAVAASDSPQNHAALALALLRSPVDSAGKEALVEARAAVKLAPEADYTELTLCEVAAATGAVAELDDCATALRNIAPHNPATHTYSAYAAIAQNKLDDANRAIDLAAGAGLPPAKVAELRARVEKRRPKASLVQIGLVGVLVGILGVPFVLVLLGVLLADARSARAHRALVALGALYFPVFALLAGVLLAGVVGVGASLFLSMVSPPRWALVVAALLAAYVLLALVRASVSEVTPEGLVLSREAEPRLWKALDRVGAEVGTRVDVVRVRPAAEIVSVVSRGKTQLHVGLFALDGLSRRAFEALVARELARVHGPGALATRELDGFDALLDRMQLRGVATAANPAWWVVAGYRVLLGWLMGGLPAAQGVRADETAATLYGSDALASGLEHVAERAQVPEREAEKLVGELVGISGPAVGVSAAEDGAPGEADAKRIAHVRSLDSEGLVSPSEEGRAWDLFAARERVEEAVRADLRLVLRDQIGEAPAP